MRNGTSPITRRRSLALGMAAGLGLGLIATTAQAMPLKNPEDYFGTPAFGATGSTGTRYELARVGRDFGHVTENPAAATTDVALANRPTVPVLGRELAGRRGAGSALSLALVRDGAVTVVDVAGVR